MVKYENFKDYLEAEVKNKSIYLWGGQGENLKKLKDDYIIKKETSAANAKRVIKLRDERKKKYPKLRAFDCSGLAVCYLLENKTIEKDMTANGFMNLCEPIKKDDLLPGDFVFRVDKDKAYHIGYVVDNLYVIESKGRDDGVVKRKLNASGSSYWNAFGRPSGIIETQKTSYSGAFVFYRNLKKGTTGEDVFNLQKLLKEHKHNPGTIDGDFGTNTEKAVKDFQAKNGLEKDGIAGKNTIVALGGIWKTVDSWSVSRMLEKGTQGDDVKLLQRELKADGFYSGKIDGIFGSGTEAAVEQCQKFNKLKVDGIAGKNTIVALGGIWKG